MGRDDRRRRKHRVSIGSGQSFIHAARPASAARDDGTSVSVGREWRCSKYTKTGSGAIRSPDPVFGVTSYEFIASASVAADDDLVDVPAGLVDAAASSLQQTEGKRRQLS